MADNRRINSVDLFRPRIQITFHTVNGTFSLKGFEKIDSVEQDIIACQTFKDINQPAGMFTIQLVDHKNYDKMINAMDLVSIQIGSHITYNPRITNYAQKEGITHATMIGFVDTVHRVRVIDPQSGKPRIYCEIKGRDFGKLLIKHQIRYIPWLLGNENTDRMSQGIKALLSWLMSGLSSQGSIAELLQIAINRMFTQAVQIKFELNGGSKNVNEVLAWRFSTGMGYIPYNLPIQAQEGTFWDILKNYCNMPWNEMWIDTIESPELPIPDSLCSVNFSTPRTESQRQAVKQVLSKQWNDLKGADYKPTGGAPTAKSDMLEERKAEFGLKDINQTGSDVVVKTLKEMQIDNANVVLMSRQTPFDNARWQALRGSDKVNGRCYNICNDDIQEQDVGIGDHDVFTYYWVKPLLGLPNEEELKGIGTNPVLLSIATQPNLALDGSGKIGYTQNPKITPSSVEKYGFTPLDLQTRVWRFSEELGNDVTLKNITNRFLLAMINWNKWNAQLFNGSITLKGSPDIHVGDMLYNADDDMEFYVESVANTYTQYGTMITTLYVTRGQYRSGNHNPYPIDWGNIMQDIGNFHINQSLTKREQDALLKKDVDRNKNL